MELYARVRRAVFVDKMSEREAARQFGLARETVRKMLRYAVPPGYRRQQPVHRPKLGAWIGTIDQILEDDKAEGRKQRLARSALGLPAAFFDWRAFFAVLAFLAVVRLPFGCGVLASGVFSVSIVFVVMVFLLDRVAVVASIAPVRRNCKQNR